MTLSRFFVCVYSWSKVASGFMQGEETVMKRSKFPAEPILFA